MVIDINDTLPLVLGLIESVSVTAPVDVDDVLPLPLGLVEGVSPFGTTPVDDLLPLRLRVLELVEFIFTPIVTPPVTAYDALDTLFGGPFTMQPTQYMINRVAAATVADVLSLADATNREVGLFKNDFAPALSTVIGDLIEADFGGYARKNGGVAESDIDPGTLQRILRVPAPVGGWAFKTTGLTNLPQTIYGFFLFGADTGELLGAFRFEDPITLTMIDQIVPVPGVYFRLLSDALQ